MGKTSVGVGVGLQLSKASGGAPASALATVGDGLAFLGSWLADSLLLQTTRTAGQVNCYSRLAVEWIATSFAHSSTLT